MLRSGCASNTSGRGSSIEQTNFFFKPVQLHLEPANLFEQRFLFYLTVARLALAAVHEQLRHLLDGCLSPGADLHGVHVVLRSQLVERPLAADRLQRYPPLNFGLYCFRVVVIALSLSRPPTPKLTYCVVQILGTIIGKRFQRPALGQIGSADALLQRAFLTVVPLRAQQSGDELGVRDAGLLGRVQLLVVHTEHAAQLQIFQELFQFFSHGDRSPYPAAESSRAPRGAESCVPAGRDRRDHTGRLPGPRPGTARADILAATATVAAGPAPPLCGLFAATPSHTRRSPARPVRGLVPRGADRGVGRLPRAAADVRRG